MKRINLILIAILLANANIAQNPLVVKYSGTIKAKDLRKHVTIIASDVYEGRNTGEKGLEMAAKYISEEFKADKLSGPVTGNENSYYQRFELERKTYTKVNLTAGKETFENHKDYSMIQKLPGTFEYDAIFAAYGIYSKTYDDYKDINVKDKLVAFFLGEPQNKEGIYLTTGTKEPSVKKDTTINGKFNSLQARAMASLLRGAKGFIIIDENDEEAAKTIKLMKSYMGDVSMNLPGKVNENMQFPILYMSPNEAARLFGSSKEKLLTAMKDNNENGITASGKFSQKVKIEIEQVIDTIKTENVLGFIEGTDKKGELLVITAHYDHEGIKNGEIYNGADDNGSGTAAIIELAEAFAIAKKKGDGPKRSILFIAFTGEEKGILGSKYYSDNPIFSIDSTISCLNIDMIGRSDKEHADSANYIYLIGSDYLSKELHQLSEKAAETYTPKLKLDYTYNAKDHPEQLYYRSDQINFANKGVPVIFYTSGIHDDYHKPTDDTEKIEFKKLEHRLKLIFATAWELANREERVKKD